MYCRNNILLVIVLYRQKLWDSKSYLSLIKHNSELPLFIYDNSPTPQHTFEEFQSNVHYVSDVSNPGLSSANNRAASYAQQKGYQWILLLNQDTFFPQNILDKYLEAINKFPEIKLIVAPMQINNNLFMSPVPIRFHFATPQKIVPTGFLSLQKYSPIDSGQMINVNALLEVGGYNENVPLDFCEFQFHQRLQKKYDKFFCIDSVCQQEFSDQVQTPEQKLKRFEIFCKCLRNCEKTGWVDSIAYFVVILKRTLYLIWFSRSFKPVSIVFSKYFKL